MNYNDFLTCLMKLSVKVYPRAHSRDEAFQLLLTDNILPLAARRCPESIDFYLENSDVQHLFHTYKDALEQIFTFYATNDKRAHGAGAPARAASGPAGFGASHLGRSPVRATKVRRAPPSRPRARRERAARARPPLTPPSSRLPSRRR
jgi:hypothetical protein